MYSVCHTKSDDVKACVKEMRKRGYCYPLFQVGKDLYNRLQSDRQLVFDTFRDKTKRHVINRETGVQHKAGCKVIERIRQESRIQAYLVRPKETGLKMCSKCC